MGQSTVLQLLPQTAYQNPGNGAPYTVEGNSVPAAAYYIGGSDLQTINFSTTNVTGNIIIEATLETTPMSDSDWFSVYEYDAISANVSMYENIRGNFVSMRATIVNFQQGIVQYVNLSY